MHDIAVLNAFGDILVVATALYAAYTLRKHPKAPINLVFIAVSFLIGAVVFMRDLRDVEYYAPMAFRFIIFSVFMVELAALMIKGFEKLRIVHLLYVFMLVPAAFAEFGQDTVLLFFGSTILISYLIAAACFAVLIDHKRGEAQSLAFIGFLGAAFPLIMVTYNPAILFAPWLALFPLGKIFLAVFFLGMALHSRRDTCYFFDPDCLKNKKNAKIRRRKNEGD